MFDLQAMERKHYKRLKHLAALITFAGTALIYWLSVEPTVSLWDCGEFLSCAYKLQVTHPPGAPFFVLIGRLFSMLAGSPEKVALWVNFSSGLASAGAAMLLCLFTMWLAERILISRDAVRVRLADALVVAGAGVVAGGTCALADSFWWSAVEAEVYALSIFLASLLLWSAIKWVERAHTPAGDRWLVFASLVGGWIIGTHLLGLLYIPVLALLYYLERRPRQEGKAFDSGLLIAFGVGALILVTVNFILIPVLPAILAHTDRLFVNSLGLPFYSGMLAVIILLAIAVTLLLWYTHRKRHYWAHMAALCLTYILLGYGSYVTMVIRSAANPPIDMNNPEDPYQLLAFIRREQYGQRPLLYGPHFATRITGYEKKAPRYKMNRDSGRYDQVGYKIEPIYDPADQMLFPRMYSQDPNHIARYRYWTGLREGEKPTFADNMVFFFRYQLGWMFWRYFLWNFAGRQNDIQGFGGRKEGNWLSGIEFLDEWRLGPQDNLPHFQAVNKGRNRYFLLPLLLGLLGCVFQLRRRQPDWWIVFTLFLFTGPLLIVYLNQPPVEPRERDYTYAGAIWSFSVWVGLGVPALFQLLGKSAFLRGRELVKALMAVAAGLVCAPVLMGWQNWDDHSRAHRFTARDFAINYLESCAPNAILFTEGDNDTYPLWYAQEVEGVRPDVRIVNLSLLGVDWYIDFLRYKVNDAPALPITVPPEKYAGSRRDYVPYVPDPRLNQERYYELSEVLDYIFSDHPSTRRQSVTGDLMDILPVRNVKITIDKKAVLESGTVRPEDSSLIVEEMRWTLPRGLLKNDLMVLHILAENARQGWKRPIYFSVTIQPSSFVGLTDYLQLEGLAYRVVPIRTPTPAGGNLYGRVATDIMYRNVTEKFRWGGMDKYEMYLDENHRRMALNVRVQCTRLVEALLTERKNDSARQIIKLCLNKIPDRNMPWDFTTAQLVSMWYASGAEPDSLITAVADTLLSRARHDLAYYLSLDEDLLGEYRSEFQMTVYIVQLLRETARQHNDTTLLRKADTAFQMVMQRVAPPPPRQQPLTP